MQPQYTPALPIETLAMLIDASGDCWEWIGSLDYKGYGTYYLKIDERWTNRFAHRLVWIALCGPIPGNLPLDHLCRNHLCVNPDHLEPVTDQINLLRGQGFTGANARKDQCKRGHREWIQRNRASGGRDCGVCKRERTRESYWRRARELFPQP